MFFLWMVIAMSFFTHKRGYAWGDAGSSGGTCGWPSPHDDKHARKRARRDARRASREGLTPEQQAERRARRRAAAEASFYGHAAVYGAVMVLLMFINLMTGGGPWFLWPAFGWGIGLFSHFMGVFGSRLLRARFFDPAVARELRRERAVMQTEKQASIDELSSTIAHEIRNPIAAAKSLVQQMGEDPQSVENVQYAQVALEELDRVERRISHLLKYAKEEDYAMDLVNLASVVDSALVQMRATWSSGMPHPLSRSRTCATLPPFSTKRSIRRPSGTAASASMALSRTFTKTWRSFSPSARTVGPPM